MFWITVWRSLMLSAILPQLAFFQFPPKSRRKKTRKNQLFKDNRTTCHVYRSSVRMDWLISLSQILPGNDRRPCSWCVSEAECHFLFPKISPWFEKRPYLPPHTPPWWTGTSPLGCLGPTPAPAYRRSNGDDLLLQVSRQSQYKWEKMRS